MPKQRKKDAVADSLLPVTPEGTTPSETPTPAPSEKTTFLGS